MSRVELYQVTQIGGDLLLRAAGHPCISVETITACILEAGVEVSLMPGSVPTFR